ncbi:hypothetical protein CIPAW_10G060800 [Carya illinoinensis]|uniref:Uncharacterized protein n=1 Tax=Carya illinoinensis TaxID=32201 RepID=A0A8T1PE33_CARIL|nr:hypothetical protein CIPAW_10G060800 [Carya illinoinensis]
MSTLSSAMSGGRGRNILVNSQSMKIIWKKIIVWRRRRKRPRRETPTSPCDSHLLSFLETLFFIAVGGRTKQRALLFDEITRLDFEYWTHRRRQHDWPTISFLSTFLSFLRKEIQKQNMSCTATVLIR